ncbi:VOC family protein [Mucilaginibacter gynuensis]|uniref:VOC family protein n=1 Tax=Mucilaginibacter gynuensis TaxID=1302236 RepID=A0ABP8H0Z5_9SPHI
MAKQIFVNLPVKDLNRSVEFFTAIGYTFNPQFTNENATCLILGDNIFAMLLVEPFFQSFTKKDIVDTAKGNEVIVCLSADSRDEVDAFVSKAVAAGGTVAGEKEDHGWMYGHGFQDLDGHLWEMSYMDMSALPQ